MVKVAAISYLNTIPFLYGLKNHYLGEEIDLQLCPPAEGARKLISNTADIGIIPVVSTFYIPNYRIVSDYCIGAINNVKSVLLSSNFTLSDISIIYLDTESMTSVTLVKILVKHYWNINVKFKSINFAKLNKFQITDLAKEQGSAFVIIGDKAMANANLFKYNCDLTSDWMNFTAKPMVFALWIANKELPKEFINNFNMALKYGVEHIKEAVQEQNLYNKEDAYNYLTKNISYNFDKQKQEGLQQFLDLAKEELL